MENKKNKDLELKQASKMHELWTKDDISLSIKDHFVAGAEYQKTRSSGMSVCMKVSKCSKQCRECIDAQ